MSRRLVANLDCEAEWTGAPLPAAVRARIAALGTLLRPLAAERDTLTLLAPVPGTRVTPVPGIPAVRTLDPRPSTLDLPTLCWGATAAIAGAPDPGAPGEDVAARLWRTASGHSVEIARACNDRRLAFRVAAELGAGLAGASVVTEPAALDGAIADATAASATGAWVAKAAICAAGRDRVRRRGAALDDATRTRLDRLLARAGALIVEPWLDRVLDLGQTGVVEPDGTVTLWPPHRLACDDGGGFRGVTIADDVPHADELAAAARTAGAAIAREGHRGAFGIDAIVHRAAGRTHLRPLVEINARLTFGIVARAWADRLGAGTLEVGAGAPPPAAHALLVPGADDDTSAWWISERWS